jgi:hypothetical protein
VAEPLGVVTVILPVVLFTDTVAVILIELFGVKLVTSTPLIFTDVTPVNDVPLITTEAPGDALVGENDVIAGATKKLSDVVTVVLGLLTLTLPVVFDDDTIAVILLSPDIV